MTRDDSIMDIKAILKAQANNDHAEFMARLLPGIDKERFVGVKTPELRTLAKEIAAGKYPGIDPDKFMDELPHELFEENQIHGFMISGMKDFDAAIERLEKFLPHIDNWATCDQTSPKIFRKNKERLLPYVLDWIRSDHVYTVRFAIGMLMQHYLKEDYLPEYIRIVCDIRSDEYYINMERAWYLATALAFRWEDALPYVKSGAIDEWTRRRTIQKAIESFRVSSEHKEILRGLR